jgi:hypothetical protein
VRQRRMDHAHPVAEGGLRVTCPLVPGGHTRLRFLSLHGVDETSQTLPHGDAVVLPAFGAAHPWHGTPPCALCHARHTLGISGGYQPSAAAVCSIFSRSEMKVAGSLGMSS